MFSGVAGQPFQRARQVQQCLDVIILLVQLRKRFFLLQRLVQRYADFKRDQLGDPVHKSIGMPQHPAHIAHHRLGSHGTIGNDLRNLFPTVTFRNIVDHPVAPFHAEVDIEVRHGYAFRIEETFEQQFVFKRIKIRDGQRIGHQRTCTRPAPRSYRHAIFLGPLDKVGNDQEVAGKPHGDNNVQLDLQALVIGFATFREIGGLRVKQGCQAVFQTLLCLLTEIPVHAQAVRNREIGQIVFTQGQFQVTPPGNLHAVFECFGQIRKQGLHLLRGAQVLLFGVAFGSAWVVQGAPVIDTDTRLVGFEIIRLEKVHVIGGYHRHIPVSRQFDRGMEILLLTVSSGTLHFQIKMPGEES